MMMMMMMMMTELNCLKMIHVKKNNKLSSYCKWQDLSLYLFYLGHLNRLFPCEWFSLAVLRLPGNLNESINVVMFMMLFIHV